MGNTVYSNGVDFIIDGNLNEVLTSLHNAGFNGDTVKDIFRKEGFTCSEENNCFEVTDFASTTFDDERMYLLLKTVAPYALNDGVIEMSGDNDYWRYVFNDGLMAVENGEIAYNNELIKPTSEVFVVSIKESDDYAGGMIGVGLSLEEAKGIVKASTEYTEGAFEYEIVKVNPGLIELDNETYRVYVRDGVVETELAADENVFELVQ